MRRVFAVLTLTAACSTVVGSAQTLSPVPSTYRNAGARTLLAAANAGETEAMLWLGVRYSNYNQDVPRSDVQAAFWFRKAAEAGDPSGMFWTGLAFWTGRGVTKDMVEAYKWMDLSARYGSVSLREQAIGVRDGLTRVMTPQMISEARTREAEWDRAFHKRKKS